MDASIIWDGIKFVGLGLGAIAMYIIKGIQQELKDLQDGHKELATTKVDKEVYNPAVLEIKQDMRDLRKDIAEIPQKVVHLLRSTEKE